MKRNDFGRPGISLFFKWWFGFVAFLAVCIISVYAFTAIKVFDALQGASAESIGTMVGKAVAAYQKEAK